MNRHLLLVASLAIFAPLVARADDKPASGASLDELLDKAAPTNDKPKPPPPPPPKDEPPAPVATPTPPPSKPAAQAKPTPPPPPPTDDNDATAVAAPPAPLAAVAPAARRVPGPYELGALDCRVLDGAGIERLLPKKITIGEEPDLLCRVLVTQPANIVATQHTLTLTVQVGAKLTYQQVRNVRMSGVGRRAIVFVVPADRLAVDDAAQVAVRVTLSAPARPAARELKFGIESLD